MKSEFPEFFPLDQAALDKLWEEAAFVVDANVLLNLYRYSESARDEFIGLLKGVESRLWLPNQAALEYFVNKETVIAVEAENYDKAIKSITSIIDDLKASRSHPFVSDELFSEINATFERIIEELKDTRSRQELMIGADAVMLELEEIFKNRTGKALPEAVLLEIFQEGEDRYANKEGPGYEDRKKLKSENPTFDDKRRCFGDLIIWKEIIKFSKDSQKDIIFVTDDQKEDWWKIVKGKKISIDPKLRAEFLNETQNEIHIYRPDRFLERASGLVKTKISDDTFTQIRELRKRNRLEQPHDKDPLEVRRGRYRRFSRRAREALMFLESHREHLNRKRAKLLSVAESAAGREEENTGLLEGAKEVEAEIKEVEKRIIHLRRETDWYSHLREETALDQNQLRFYVGEGNEDESRS